MFLAQWRVPPAAQWSRTNYADLDTSGSRGMQCCATLGRTFRSKHAYCVPEHMGRRVSRRAYRPSRARATKASSLATRAARFSISTCCRTIVLCCSSAS